MNNTYDKLQHDIKFLIDHISIKTPNTAKLLIDTHFEIYKLEGERAIKELRKFRTHLKTICKGVIIPEYKPGLS